MPASAKTSAAPEQADTTESEEELFVPRGRRGRPPKVSPTSKCNTKHAPSTSKVTGIGEKMNTTPKKRGRRRRLATPESIKEDPIDDPDMPPSAFDDVPEPSTSTRNPLRRNSRKPLVDTDTGSEVSNATTTTNATSASSKAGRGGSHPDTLGINLAAGGTSPDGSEIRPRKPSEVVDDFSDQDDDVGSSASKRQIKDDIEEASSESDSENVCEQKPPGKQISVSYEFFENDDDDEDSQCNTSSRIVEIRENVRVPVILPPKEDNAVATGRKKKRTSSPDPWIENPWASKFKATDPIGIQQFYTIIHNNLNEAVRSVYQSANPESDEKTSLKQLMGTYNKILSTGSRDPKKYFIDEMLFFASLMIEHNSPETMDARLRGMRLIARFCVLTLRDGYMEISESLFEFIQEMAWCISVAVRQNVVTLIGFLYCFSTQMGKNFNGKKQRADKENREDGGSEGDNHVISLQERRELYVILRMRQTDKMVSVRKEVIRAAAYIQDDMIPACFTEAIECSPKDMIINAIHDVSPECRLTAIGALRISDASHISDLIESATMDKNVSVRKAAIAKLGKTSMSMLTEDQRVDILASTLQDCNVTIRDASCHTLLAEWLEQISKMQKKRRATKDEPETPASDNRMASTIMGLLHVLNCVTETKECRIILNACFRLQRHHLGMQSVPMFEYIREMINGCDGTDMIYARNIDIMVNNNKKQIVRCVYAFFWRSLIEYIVKNANDEGDKLECLHRLNPGMLPTCKMVQQFLEMPPTETPDDTLDLEYQEKVNHFMLMEFFGVLRHLDRTDSAAMKAWRDLLDSFLSERVDELKKVIADDVIQDIVEAFHSNDEENALHYFCDVTAALVHKARNPDMTIMNGTIAIGSAMEEEEEEEEPSLDIKTHYQCLMIVHAAFKTGLFRHKTSLLDSLFHSFVVPAFELRQEENIQTTQMRVWAVETLGVFSLFDESFAETQTSFFRELFHVDTDDVRKSILIILTDIIMVHRYEKTAHWFETDITVPEGRPDTLIREFYCAIQKAQDGPLAHTACESACKLMFNESRMEWNSVLSLLVMRLFHATTILESTFRSCLAQFVPVFASLQRANQLVLADCFCGMINYVRGTSPSDANGYTYVRGVDLERACNYVVHLTHRSMLAENAPGRDEEPVHVFLIQKILRNMVGALDDEFVYLHTMGLATVSLEGMSDDVVRQFRIETYVLCDDLEAIYSKNHKAVKYLKHFIANCEKMVKKLEHQKGKSTESDADQGANLSALAELPNASNVRKSPARKRSTPVKASSSPSKESTPKKTIKKVEKKTQPSTMKKAASVAAAELLNVSADERHLERTAKKQREEQKEADRRKNAPPRRQASKRAAAAALFKD